MFYSLTGLVTLTGPGFAVVNCGGVGFKCLTTANTLKELTVEEKTTLYTHLNVREDALDLFAFSTEQELEYFRTLLSVSGIGPKMAISVLSELPPDKLAAAVALGDHRLLTKAPGVGAKIAQRMVLELKDKLPTAGIAKLSGETAASTPSGLDVALLEDAVTALQALGFNKNEATAAVSRCGGGKTVEEIIGKALRSLS